MFLHLIRVETELPGRTASWYITSCHFHARHYLERGRSVDSIKRGSNLVPLRADHDDGDGGFDCRLDAADPVDVHGELVMRDIVNQLSVRLTDRQQRILLLLLRGFSVREIGRELSLGLPTILQHRKTIRRVASYLLSQPADSELPPG